MFLLIVSALAAGNQARFDGGSDYIDLGDSLDPGSSFTVEMWVNLDTTGTNGYDSFLEVVDLTNAQNTFYVGWVGSRWQVEFNDPNGTEGGSCSDGTEVICASDTMSTGTDYHVAVSVDGTDVTLFIDGVEADTLTLASAVSWGSEQWVLGADTDNGTNWSSDSFDGVMDEVRIWDVARDEDDLACTLDWALTGDEVGLYGLWHMDDATSSTTAVDDGPNALDGTVGGDTDFEASGFGLTEATANAYDITCFDYDQDGYSQDDGDCDESDATINPGATEVYYDGVDQNCDSLSDYDADQDGYDSDAYGGTDCDDTDAAINPGETDTPLNGIDDDCDGYDSGEDTDGDGLSDEDEVEIHGTDPDDSDSDDDGLSDGDEVNTTSTDPLDDDSEIGRAHV